MGDELLIAAARRLQATLPRQRRRRSGRRRRVPGRGARRARPAHALDVADDIRRNFATPFWVARRTRSPCRPASVWPCSPRRPRAPAPRRCSATPTRRCTRPRQAAATPSSRSTPPCGSASPRRVKLERELRHALKRQELEVHFQPVVRAEDGHVCGLEALLRWTHPWLGVGAARPVHPRGRGQRPDRRAGRLGPRPGLRPDRPAAYAAAAPRKTCTWRSTCPPASCATTSCCADRRPPRRPPRPRRRIRCACELTESLLMENIERTAGCSRRCGPSACGSRIDDFGTGYSSLAYLKRLPVDEVKIDQSFVTDIGAGGADTSVVSAVVAIAGSFGMSTVAEGVEEEAQAERLLELGCRRPRATCSRSAAAPAARAITRLGARLARVGLSSPLDLMARRIRGP